MYEKQLIYGNHRNAVATPKVPGITSDPPGAHEGSTTRTLVTGLVCRSRQSGVLRGMRWLAVEPLISDSQCSGRYLFHRYQIQSHS